jgi:hypothetical protein
MLNGPGLLLTDGSSGVIRGFSKRRAQHTRQAPLSANAPLAPGAAKKPPRIAPRRLLAWSS